MGTYKVQKGDTLSAIAKRYGTTADEIAKANNIKDVNKIYAGQTINIGSYNSSPSGNSTATAGTYAASTDPSTLTKPTAPTFDYKPSDDVTNAYNLLNEWIKNKPGEYVSKWQTYIDETLNKILNREKFSYDLNGDMLYQQYKDQYTTQGKLAMMDTMGQAAAMTGGYGNSYAQTAGQQAYQGYLQQLNDKIPELYQLALDQYNQEGQELYNQYGLYVDRDSQDYNKYRDSMSDYYTDLQWLTDNARYMSETEYERAWNEFQAKYGAYRDNVADDQWQAEFDFAKQQYEDSQKTKKNSGPTGNNGNNGDNDDNDGDGGDVPSYGSVLDKCREYIRNGASKSEISNYLREAYKAGYITKAEYDELKKTYTPRGNTY